MSKMRHSVISELYVGSAGSATFRSSTVGQQLTKRSYPKDAKTERQLESRGDFTDGSDGYALLTSAEKKLWAAWSKSRTRRDPVTNKSYSLAPRAAYIGLASKFAQINPGMALPTVPPLMPFRGDRIVVTAEEVDGAVLFSASDHNRVGAATELLAQRLSSIDRSPQEDDYLSYGFTTFPDASGNEQVIELGLGIWSLAYRFVCPSTGEEKGLRPLGTVMLGLAMVDGDLEEPEVPAKRRKAA